MKQITSLGPKECILCTTQEECDIIMDMMHDAGLTWRSGCTYKEHRRYDYLPNQCYDPSSGMRGDEKTYKSLGYTIYPASDFIENKWKPKQGERVLVRDLDSDDRLESIFLCEIPKVHSPYICVYESNESDYLMGKKVSFQRWKQIKQLPKEVKSTYTIECTEEQYKMVQDLISK